MKKAQKENLIFRLAMLDAIAETLRENNTHCLSFEEGSYADERDMIHFTCDGHKCILLSIEKPNLEKMTCTMSVKVVGKGCAELLRLNFDCSHFRCNTLERIAYEVYDWLKESDWEDWHTYKKNLVAGYFDTYMSELFGMNTMGNLI